jgi:tricorn protease
VNLASAAPPLLDGGTVSAPSMSMCAVSGDCEVENQGVAPDIEIDDDPKSVAEGHDLQLERAVTLLLNQLKRNPPQPLKAPTYPDYHKDDGLGTK